MNYRNCRNVLAVTALAAVLTQAQEPAKQITLQLRDYLTMPDPGKLDPKSQNNSVFSRLNFFREEPGPDRNRFFVNHVGGPLYIVDKKTKQITTYLDFNGKAGRKGLFHRLVFETGYASGLVSFEFDPDYQHNGRFYTIHMEDPAVTESAVPDNASFPALNVKGYAVTPPIATPGASNRESVVVEWTDTNPANLTFEGTARELMRVQLNTQIHPMDDLIFNPTAKPGDPDWRALYIACGDGGSGEKKDAIRNNPQRLDNLVGKILRIFPDLNERKDSTTVSDNGRYRVPRDNPFAARPGAKPEIWAYGLRNPHRMTWDVDPSDPKKNYLIANVIGLQTWETVVIIHKGGNYGYSEREGNQQLLAATNRTGPIPADDRIPLRIGEEPTGEMVTPLYPVIQFGHVPEGGDAIANGVVYRGKFAALRGKFIFADMTTGHIWWADLKEMLAADDGKPQTMAKFYPVELLWSPAGGKDERYASMAPIASAGYHARGGEAPILPGFISNVAKNRADIRLALDRKGELYVMSKSDGMIREVIAATAR